VAARKRLRVGFIGAGGIARMHARGFLALRDVELVAMAEPSRKMIEAMKKEALEPNGAEVVFYKNHRDMLKKEDLDAVLIATPHTLHFAHAIDALDAGCHVLMEKPMVTDAAQARKLVHRVERSDRVFALAHQSTYSPHHAAVRRFLAEGRAGEITSVVAYVAQGFWKDLCSGTWRTNPRLSGGGQLYDTGSHLLNSLLWLLNDPMVEVAAFLDKRGTKVDIISAVCVRFKSGTLATIMVSGEAAAHATNNIILFGSKATIETGIWGQCAEARDGKEKPLKLKLPKLPSMYQQFVEVIRGKRVNPCPPLFGLRLSLLCDAIYKSAKMKKAVRVRQV